MVRRWIRAGRLRSQRVGTQHLIEEHDLEALLDDDEDMLPLPDEWRFMSDGQPQPTSGASYPLPRPRKAAEPGGR